MSVTFWVPDAPRSEVPCQYCTPEENCLGPGAMGCSGVRLESDGPEANFNNSNANMLCRLLRLDPECGSLEHGELVEFQRVIEHLLDCSAIIEEHWASRLRRIQRVAVWAQANGYGITWA